MKILVIGHPRSRTTPLICSLSYHNRVNNFNEVYDYCKIYSLPERTAISQSADPSAKKLKFFKEKVSLLTDQLFAPNSLQVDNYSKFKKSLNSVKTHLLHNDSFAVKLFPRYFNASLSLKNLNSYVLDISRYFNILKYDKIYTTKRNNIADALASWHLGKLYGNHTFYHQDHINIFNRNMELLKKNTVLTLTEEYQTFLIEVFLIEKICQYLEKNKISYVNLEYHSIPNYIAAHCPCDNTEEFLKNNPKMALWAMPLQLNFDYKSIISNYNEIEDMALKFQDQSKELFQYINFI